jgi:hypothetical protein
MKQKHGELMTKRKIDDARLLALMRTSERQVFDFHFLQPEVERSLLLSLYFRSFGKA